MTDFLSDRSIYTSVVCSLVPRARERLWIATSDIKDMYVDTSGRDMVLFLEVLGVLGVPGQMVHKALQGVCQEQTV